MAFASNVGRCSLLCAGAAEPPDRDPPLEGKFAPAIEWIMDYNDPKIVCHPVISMVTDMVWERVAFRTFLSGKLWFLFTLVVFVLSQSILNHTQPHGADGPPAERIAIFSCRTRKTLRV